MDSGHDPKLRRCKTENDAGSSYNLPLASARKVGIRYVVNVLAKTPGDDHACDDGGDQEYQPAYHSDPIVVTKLRELDSGMYA